MNRIVVIENCTECKHNYYKYDILPHKTYCSHPSFNNYKLMQDKIKRLSEWIFRKTMKDIPTWCPLDKTKPITEDLNDGRRIVSQEW